MRIEIECILCVSFAEDIPSRATQGLRPHHNLVAPAGPQPPGFNRTPFTDGRRNPSMVRTANAVSGIENRSLWSPLIMTSINRLRCAVSAIALGLAVFSLPGVARADAGHSHAANIGQPGKAAQATRTVEVTLGDNYYEPESLQVKAGETIRFVLTNTGEFLHEFNIGTAAMHSAHQEEMAMMVEHGMLTPTGIDQNMMNMDHSNMKGAMKHDDLNSALVEPGKTAELTWKFTKTVDLQFACNMPGHYEAGMVGDIEFTH